MSIIGKLAGGAAGGILQGANGIIKTVWGDKSAREENHQAAFIAALNQFATEGKHATRTKFDALVDGINRMPRPLIAFGVIGLFIYAMIDPIGFAVRMQGIALIPEALWWIMGAVVSFFFGARELQKMRGSNAMTIDREDVANVLQNVREIRALEPDTQPGVAEAEPEIAFEAMPFDENVVLSKWNQQAGA